VAGCCECGDEPSGSCATELVSYLYDIPVVLLRYGNAMSLSNGPWALYPFPHDM
jgi:hypothetical protein